MTPSTLPMSTSRKPKYAPFIRLAAIENRKLSTTKTHTNYKSYLINKYDVYSVLIYKQLYLCQYFHYLLLFKYVFK